MGIIEPYHFVGIGRQGPIALGEQLARFEWMKLQMQKFYSSCDTAQNTHGKKFSLRQMDLKRDHFVAGSF